jgi:hypothetical protein
VDGGRDASAGHELSALARRLRAGMIERWAAVLHAPPSPGARGLVWGLFNALFGLAEMVDDATITADQAVRELGLLIEAAAPRLTD